MQSEINRLEYTVAEQESTLVSMRHRVRDLEGQLHYERAARSSGNKILRSMNPQLRTPDRDERHENEPYELHAPFHKLRRLSGESDYPTLPPLSTDVPQCENRVPQCETQRETQHKTQRETLHAPAHASAHVAPHATLLADYPAPHAPQAAQAAHAAPATSTPAPTTASKPKREAVCISCKITSSTCWRGSWGAGKLCNSCGLKYYKTRTYCGVCCRVATASDGGPGSACSCGGVLQFKSK